MKPFYKDQRTLDEINSTYSGKTLFEIQKLEKERFAGVVDEIDSKHEEYVNDNRKNMLTVQKLIDYLKTQDPDACILAYEQNSDAYIEQLSELPSYDIQTVAEAKKHMEEDLKQLYRGMPNANLIASNEVSTVFRYAKDNDVIIQFA